MGEQARDHAIPVMRVQSCDDVGQQPAFQPGDLVLQRKLPFFQPLKLKLIIRGLFADTGDHIVEVAVLNTQRRQLLLQNFLFIHR